MAKVPLRKDLQDFIEYLILTGQAIRKSVMCQILCVKILIFLQSRGEIKFRMMQDPLCLGNFTVVTDSLHINTPLFS